MKHLEAIPYFLSVADQGSFAAAARELGISRSAVNKRVIQLEENLGVRLLHRTTRQISLTESGEHYYQHAKQAWYWLQRAEDSATSQQDQATGTLNINVPMSFGRLIVVPLISGFLKAFPGIQINMTMSDEYLDIIAGGYDLAIRGGVLKDSSLIARRLVTSRSVICASPEYFTPNAIPTEPSELKDCNALLYEHQSATSEWTFSKMNNIENIPVNGNYRVNNSEALLMAAQQGLGIARLPDFVAYPEIKKGKLIQLLADYKMPEKNLYLIYPEREHMPLKLKCFLDYLSSNIAPESEPKS